MNLQRLTEKSQEALRNAQALAIRRSHQGVDAEHLLAALLDTPQSLATSIVERAGSNVTTLREALEREVQKIPQVTGSAPAADQVFITQRLARILTKAEDEAQALKDEYVSIEHLLLAMLDDAGGVGRALKSVGLTRTNLLSALQAIRGHQRVTSANPEDTYQALEK